jgi:hypothetical protein
MCEKSNIIEWEFIRLIHNKQMPMYICIASLRLAPLRYEENSCS